MLTTIFMVVVILALLPFAIEVGAWLLAIFLILTIPVIGVGLVVGLFFILYQNARSDGHDQFSSAIVSVSLGISVILCNIAFFRATVRDKKPQTPPLNVHQTKSLRLNVAEQKKLAVEKEAAWARYEDNICDENVVGECGKRTQRYNVIDNIEIRNCKRFVRTLNDLY